MLTLIVGEIVGVFACVCYLIATVLQVQSIWKGRHRSGLVKSLGAVAVIGHGFAIYNGFFSHEGYDLGLYPMLSLMALSIVGILLISSFHRPVENLLILVFPLAAVTVLMDALLIGDYTPRGRITEGIIGHIVLSIIAYSILTIASVQAVLLSLGDNLLRQHQLVLLRNMPPLQTMEALMFELLWAGLVFLTLSIVSGFVFLEDLSGPGLVHHTVITLAAWVVFMVLLWGRYRLGWRGAIASRWALAGFVLLALGYFGSKLVLEVILGRA